MSSCFKSSPFHHALRVVLEVRESSGTPLDLSEIHKTDEFVQRGGIYSNYGPISTINYTRWQIGDRKKKGG